MQLSKIAYKILDFLGDRKKIEIKLQKAC